MPRRAAVGVGTAPWRLGRWSDERDVGRRVRKLDLPTESVFGDAGHDARRNVAEIVGGVGVVRQDDLEPTSKRRPGGGTHAHLREQPTDRDAAHTTVVQQLAESSPCEAVVCRLPDNCLIWGREDLNVEGPAGLLRLVDSARFAVVLEVNDKGVGLSRSGQESLETADQAGRIWDRLVTGQKACLRVDDDERLDRHSVTPHLLCTMHRRGSAPLRIGHNRTVARIYVAVPDPMADRFRDPNEPGFNPAYRGTPPWDIGRPQTEFVRLEEMGEIQGSVLDVGCGTGEHVLYLAQRGHEAWGIDAAPLAIDKATRKAAQRGIQATFAIADAFELRVLGRTFDTVIDSGLLHVFAPELRPRFVASLGAVVSPGATYIVLGYSDDDPGSGPRGYSPDDIRQAFADGWRMNYIREAQFDIVDVAGHKTKAWLSSLSRQ